MLASRRPLPVDFVAGQQYAGRKMAETSCLIVGAGLAGLQAARRLGQLGHQAIVLERAEQLGGRLRTRRVTCPDGRIAVFDTGAQFFTVRSERFRVQVDEWLAAGVVKEWSRGFAAVDGSYYRDGYPRYCGTVGMDSMATHLARDIDIRLGCGVSSVRRDDSHWIVETEGDESLCAEALILALPAPQALALLRHGDCRLAAETEAALTLLTFDPCLALMVTLAGPSRIPEPGGIWPADDAIAWLADNQRKGISPVPAVTIHGTPEFSREYFEADTVDIMTLLLQAAADYLGADVADVHLERWRYSIPVLVHPEPCLFLPGPPPLLFAGDAFAGPRVEGAVLSGLTAADRLQASMPT